MIYDLGAMAYRLGRRADVQLHFTGPTGTQEDDLRRILMTVVRHWSVAVPEIVRARFTDSPGESDIERTHAEGVVVAAAATASLWAWVRSMDRWRRDQFIRVVNIAVGVDTSGMAPLLINSDELRVAVEWAVALIRDLNDDMRRRMVTTMIDASQRGATRLQIEKSLRDIVGLSQRRAALIARDQTQKIAAKTNELQQRAAGIDKYVWQHSFKKNPRRHHVARQGKVFSWSRPPYDGHPGHAINCRCGAVALLNVKTRQEVYLNADAG